MNDTVLEIKNLSKSFAKNTVLNGINLSVKKGSVMGLMGENGAGKSTMMKCLFGIYAKDEGQISLLGKPIDFKELKINKEEENGYLENTVRNLEPFDHSKVIQIEDKKQLKKLFKKKCS